MRLGTHCKFTLIPVDFVRSDLVGIIQNQFQPEPDYDSSESYPTVDPSDSYADNYADGKAGVSPYDDGDYGNYGDYEDSY